LRFIYKARTARIGNTPLMDGNTPLTTVCAAARVD
jgi:hypothetical protein